MHVGGNCKHSSRVQQQPCDGGSRPLHGYSTLITIHRDSLFLNKMHNKVGEMTNMATPHNFRRNEMTKPSVTSFLLCNHKAVTASNSKFGLSRAGARNRVLTETWSREGHKRYIAGVRTTVYVSTAANVWRVVLWCCRASQFREQALNCTWTSTKDLLQNDNATPFLDNVPHGAHPRQKSSR
jgi:hypothetical protein